MLRHAFDTSAAQQVATVQSVPNDPTSCPVLAAFWLRGADLTPDLVGMVDGGEQLLSTVHLHRADAVRLAAAAAEPGNTDICSDSGGDIAGQGGPEALEAKQMLEGLGFSVAWPTLGNKRKVTHSTPHTPHTQDTRHNTQHMSRNTQHTTNITQDKRE